VEIGRAVVDELLDELGDVGAGSPLSGEVADLLLGGDLAGQEKPEETLGKRLLAAGGLGEKLLDLGDGLAAEADTLLRVEDGTLPDEGLDATGTAIDLVEGDLVDDLGTVLPVVQTVVSRRAPSATGVRCTDFRRALICSTFSGIWSAKVSLRVWMRALVWDIPRGQLMAIVRWLSAHLGLRRVASRSVESRSPASKGRSSEGSPQGRVAKTTDGSHCDKKQSGL
jgi:hypothetical protein